MLFLNYLAFIESMHEGQNVKQNEQMAKILPRKYKKIQRGSFPHNILTVCKIGLSVH